MVSDKRTACAGLLLLAALFFLVLVTPDSEAATYTVDNIDDGADYSNITQAVDNASAGDTIRVASRTYYDAVDVDKRLTLIGGNYGISMNGLTIIVTIMMLSAIIVLTITEIAIFTIGYGVKIMMEILKEQPEQLHLFGALMP